MRYELSNFEWAAIRPFLPNKPRGVPRVNDRRVLNGIFWVLRSGAPWRDLPEAFGPFELRDGAINACPLQTSVHTQLTRKFKSGESRLDDDVRHTRSHRC